LGEWRGTNHQAIFISNNFKCFLFGLKFMYCIFLKKILEVVFSLYFMASYLNWFFLKKWINVEAPHPNVGFHPWILDDSNCLQVEV